MSNAIAEAALYLAAHVDQLRAHPAAAEAWAELTAACRELERIVDRPADKELVGVCDCGKVLYAGHGRSVVKCPQPTCKLTWDVAESRDILRRHLGDKLVTAAEAARLSAYMDTDRTQEQIRKLINKWAERGELVVHRLRDEDAYRFGEVAGRLASTPRRERRAQVAAEMGA